jgi:septal ring factor EnvC (AmiA/AmiB activator)
VVYGGVDIESRGRASVVVGTQGPAQQRTGDMPGMWRQVGELIARGQSLVDARFDRLEGDVAVLKTDVAVLKTDVAVLKTDVAVLKTDMAETKEQLGRLERATETRFNRVDAQLERLITLVQRAETSRS